MKKSQTPLEELEEGITNLQAIIAYREAVLRDYEERVRPWKEQIQEAAVQIQSITKIRDTAAEVIQAARTRISSMQTHRSLLKLTGAETKRIKDPVERKALQLRALMANITELQKVIEDAS